MPRSGTEVIDKAEREQSLLEPFHQLHGGPKYALPSAEPKRELPLHAKHVQVANIERISQLSQVTSPETQRKWNAALLWLSPSPYIDAEIATSTSHRRHQKVSTVSREDTKVLLDAKIIERAPRHRTGAPFIGLQFSVEEPAKHRRRSIMACYATNDMIKAVYTQKELTLPTVQEQQQQLLAVRGKVKALCFDLTASFFQFELQHETRRFFAFNTREGMFQYTRLPMGFTRSCDVLQAGLTVLAEAAVARMPAGVEVSFLVYVDNVRFIVEEEWAVRMGKEFRDVCGEAGITLNAEELNAPHFQGEFLSQGYSVIDKSAWIAKKAAPKLQEAREAILSDKTTWKTTRAAFGRIFWAMEVAGIQWANFFRVKDFYRRKCAEFVEGKFVEDSLTPLWPSAREEFTRLADILTGPSAKVRWVFLPEKPEVVLFTDASSTGYGGVLVAGKHTKTFRAVWADEEKALPINVLEAIATNRACQNFVNDIRGKDVQVVIDNAAERFCLQKGESKSFDLNAQIMSLLKSLKVCPTWSVIAIASAKNPADEPSRGLPIDQRKVKEAIPDCSRNGVVFRHRRC